MIAHRNGWAALVTAVVGLLCAAAAYAARGSEGAWSALLAAGVVVAFMSAGSIPLVVAGDTRDGRGAVGFVVLGLTYALRLVLGVVLFGVVSSSGSLDTRVVGLVVVASAIAWTATHVVLGLSRRHAPTLDL